MRRLYEAYAPYLSGVCARYITDADDQKDVLQEAFINIFTHISSFTYRGSGSLRSWLVRITVNQALMSLREKSRLQFAELPMVLPDVAEPPDVEGLSESVILEMIRRLPVGCRTVFNLYAIEGKSHKEIAAMLGIKTDSSASQYSRARAMLAKMINDYKRQQRL